MLLSLALAGPVLAAPAATSSSALASAEQALPPAALPDAKLVSAGIDVQAPRPTAEHALEMEIAAATSDTPDEPQIKEEIDRESAELEDMRQAEEASKVQEKGTEEPAHVPGEGRIALLPELDHDLAQLQAEYDIPVEVNAAVVQYVRFFQSPVARKHFVKWLGRSHRYIERYRVILKDEGLPQDTVYLAMIESGFGNFAYSRARASGPWQFIGPTGKHYGLQQDFWVDERRDPEKSAHAAAQYLKKLYEQTGDWRLAWAGYNAGVGRIFKARDKGYGDFWSMAAVPGRRVLRAETKGYVPKLMAAAIIAKHPEAFGFRAEEIEKEAWREYEEVKIPSATLLSVLAGAAGVTERELIDLNPELRRACTPPREYGLKIPKGQAEAFAQAWPAIQGKARMTFAAHVVRRGDTISSVALRYGVPMQGILELNGLKTAKRLRPGQELVIPKPIGGGTTLAAARAPDAGRPEAAARHRSVVQVRAASGDRADRARTTLRVRAGDTLWSISRRLGVGVDDLCRWNGIDSRRDKLLVGKQLVVYAERG
jgi:membrane-bound lytic murein transglycosylase D